MFENPLKVCGKFTNFPTNNYDLLYAKKIKAFLGDTFIFFYFTQLLASKITAQLFDCSCSAWIFRNWPESTCHFDEEQLCPYSEKAHCNFKLYSQWGHMFLYV